MEGKDFRERGMDKQFDYVLSSTPLVFGQWLDSTFRELYPGVLQQSKSDFFPETCYFIGGNIFPPDEVSPHYRYILSVVAMEFNEVEGKPEATERDYDWASYIEIRDIGGNRIHLVGWVSENETIASFHKLIANEIERVFLGIAHNETEFSAQEKLKGDPPNTIQISEQERKIIEMWNDGYIAREISEIVKLAPRTIQNKITILRKKLGPEKVIYH